MCGVMSVCKAKKGLAGFVGFCRWSEQTLLTGWHFTVPKGWGGSLGMLISGRHRGSSGPSLSRLSEGTVLGAGVACIGQ